MKKNAVGRVLVHKEPVGKRISALHFPAWILCLLLALVIWLAVTNVSAISGDTDSTPETEVTCESV